MTLSTSIQLSRTLELTYLTLGLQLFCGCKKMYTFLWTQELILLTNSTITCSPFDRSTTSTIISSLPWTSYTTMQYWKKKSVDYDKNITRLVEIFSHRGWKLLWERVGGTGFSLWGLDLNEKASLWKVFPYRPAREFWKIFSIW